MQSRNQFISIVVLVFLIFYTCAISSYANYLHIRSNCECIRIQAYLGINVSKSKPTSKPIYEHESKGSLASILNSKAPAALVSSPIHLYIFSAQRTPAFPVGIIIYGPRTRPVTPLVRDMYVPTQLIAESLITLPILDSQALDIAISDWKVLELNITDPNVRECLVREPSVVPTPIQDTVTRPIRDSYVPEPPSQRPASVAPQAPSRYIYASFRYVDDPALTFTYEFGTFESSISKGLFVCDSTPKMLDSR